MAGKKYRQDGRNFSGPSVPHIQIEIWILHHPAYKAMSIGARLAYGYLLSRYNGQNNGHIGMGWRKLADMMGVNKETAGKYLQELYTAGFIVPCGEHEFSPRDVGGRRQQEWRLTTRSYNGHKASYDFKHGYEETQGGKTRSNRPEFPDNGHGSRAASPEKPCANPSSSALKRTEKPPTCTSSHRQGASIPGENTTQIMIGPKSTSKCDEPADALGPERANPHAPQQQQKPPTSRPVSPPAAGGERSIQPTGEADPDWSVIDGEIALRLARKDRAAEVLSSMSLQQRREAVSAALAILSRPGRGQGKPESADTGGGGQISEPFESGNRMARKYVHPQVSIGGVADLRA